MSRQLLEEMGFGAAAIDAAMAIAPTGTVEQLCELMIAAADAQEEEDLRGPHLPGGARLISKNRFSNPEEGATVPQWMMYEVNEDFTRVEVRIMENTTPTDHHVELQWRMFPRDASVHDRLIAKWNSTRVVGASSSVFLPAHAIVEIRALFVSDSDASVRSAPSETLVFETDHRTYARVSTDVAELSDQWWNYFQQPPTFDGINSDMTVAQLRTLVERSPISQIINGPGSYYIVSGNGEMFAQPSRPISAYMLTRNPQIKLRMWTGQHLLSLNILGAPSEQAWTSRIFRKCKLAYQRHVLTFLMWKVPLPILHQILAHSWNYRDLNTGYDIVRLVCVGGASGIQTVADLKEILTTRVQRVDHPCDFYLRINDRVLHNTERIGSLAGQTQAAEDEGNAAVPITDVEIDFSGPSQTFTLRVECLEEADGGRTTQCVVTQGSVAVDIVKQLRAFNPLIPEGGALYIRGGGMSGTGFVRMESDTHVGKLGKTRHSWFISGPTTLYYTIPSPNQVWITTLTGKVLSMDVPFDTLVEDLKQIIQNMEGIPVDQQRLIFAGKQLMDGHSLRDVGVVTNSLITLVLRLRGD